MVDQRPFPTFGPVIDGAEMQQQLAGIGVPVGHAEFLGRRFGPCSIGVADGDDVDTLRRQILPRMQVVLREEAAADQAKSNAFGHLGSHFLSSRHATVKAGSNTLPMS